MGLQDKLSLHAMQFVEARALDDETKYGEAWKSLDDSDVDPIDVVDLLASMLVPYFTRDPSWESKMKEILAGLELAVSMDIDDFDDSRIAKPGPSSDDTKN